MTNHSRIKDSNAKMRPHRNSRRRQPIVNSQGRREAAVQEATDDGIQEVPGSTPRGYMPRLQPFPPRQDSPEPQPRPRPHLFGQLRILPSAEISLSPGLVIQNPRAKGPQTDICARVPGQFNTWVARTSCDDTRMDLWDLVVANSGLSSPQVAIFMGNSEQGYTTRSTGVGGEMFLQPVKNQSIDSIYWTNQLEHGNQETGWGYGEMTMDRLSGILGEEGMKMVV
ncbi:hypothetical protein FGRMN_10378 [Fusarium graminum]|nr:hypothetical protein FGRMN_10378 [Fusarium graminum]